MRKSPLSTMSTSTQASMMGLRKRPYAAINEKSQTPALQKRKLPTRHQYPQAAALGVTSNNMQASLKTKKKERDEMMARFVASVGEFRTLEEVEIASQWMTSMQCTKDDLQKFETFNKHAENTGLQKIWPEIIMYRTIGQISTFFLDGQSLRDSKPIETNMNALDELEISVVGWVRLASEGRLSRMEEFLEVEDGGGQYDSHAERFRGLLRAHKRKHNFVLWNHDRLKMLRYKIYRVVHEHRDATQISVPRHDHGAIRRDQCSSRLTEEGERSQNGLGASQRLDTRVECSPSATSRAGNNDELYTASPRPRPSAPPTTNQTHTTQTWTGSNIRRDDLDDADETHATQVARRINTMETSLKAKREALKEAQEVAERAKAMYSNFEEQVLSEVKNILRDRRPEGGWNLRAAREQAEELAVRFTELARVAPAQLERDLVNPLATEEDIGVAVRIAEEEVLRLRQELDELDSESDGDSSGERV